MFSSFGYFDSGNYEDPYPPPGRGYKSDKESEEIQFKWWILLVLNPGTMGGVIVGILFLIGWLLSKI